MSRWGHPQAPGVHPSGMPCADETKVQRDLNVWPSNEAETFILHVFYHNTCKKKFRAVGIAHLFNLAALYQRDSCVTPWHFLRR